MNTDTSSKVRFPRDESFDAQFDRIEGLSWYPYVGKDFTKCESRVMVFAHNIPIPAKDYDAKLHEWKARDTWASSDTIEEYTYCRGWWSKTFRSFLKGAVGLQEDFDEHSDAETLGRIEAFLHKISYINFIQGLVKSETQIAMATAEQIELSIKVNREILGVLGVTHCICWGKPVFEYVQSMAGFRTLSEASLPRSGFSSCTLDVGNGSAMHCLRIYHPSMPGFGPFGTDTQSIIAAFLATEVSKTRRNTE
jgi:hypothetical protein